MKRSLFPFGSVLPVLALTLCAGVDPVPAAEDPWASLPRYHVGQSREPLATIEEQIRKSGPADRAGIERRLLEVLQSPQTTKDSRRAICHWLGTVGSEQSVPPLAALLTEPDLSHPARMGLESLPYPSAGNALTDALPKVKGKLLAGVISSIGARRVAEAVPALAGLVNDPDSTVAEAALAALGEIGSDAASKTLATAQVKPALARDLARARVSAANRLAESGNASEAAAVFKSLMNDAGQPPEIRAAGFQGLAKALPASEAAGLIVDALEGDATLLRPAAVKAFAGAGAARSAIASRLPAMRPRGQLLLLGILADAPDVEARQPLLEVARSANDPAVQAAAVECLASHGQAADVPLVASWAAAGDQTVRAAARKTLQRISGPGVDAALLRVVESADAPQRQVVLEAIPARRMSSAFPTLARMMAGGDAVAAAQAAKAMGQMGGTTQIQDLARVITATGNAELRAAAQEAVRSICSRAEGEDGAAAAGVIWSELARAASPEARVALLPLTVYAGGEAGLEQVLKAMQEENQEVRGAAFRTLVAWPEARAAAPLLRFAETNREGSLSIVALRDGCLRLAETEEVSVADRAAILQGVVRAAQRPEEKRRAVSLMGQVPSLDLLRFATQLAGEKEVRGEAVAAVVQLARGFGAVSPRQSLTALEAVDKYADTPELRKLVQDGVRAVRNAGQSPEGFIMGWLLSGPYTQPDKDAGALFDVVFPPEQPSAPAEWRPLTAPANGLVDLGKPMPGENRVAYLRAAIQTDAAQKALLELGSDDGIKVWLNGEVVHANNAVRPCTPGQDKVNVSLKPGENVLLLKVTQGGGEFMVVARLRGSDGKPLSGVTVGAAGN